MKGCIGKRLEFFKIEMSEHWCSWQELGERTIKNPMALGQFQIFDPRDVVDECTDATVKNFNASSKVEVSNLPWGND